MRQLVLLRHEKATPGSNTGEDFDRPLAQRGRDDAPVVGRALAEAGAAPQVVLVSAARRTRETWELVAASFQMATVRYVDKLYLAPGDLIMREAEESGVANVMVIAHNPGLHELASRLAHRLNAMESRVRAKFPTAAAAFFTRKDDHSSWKLQDYITPKDATD
jgi:phosphohistidine phosphatase